MTRGSMLLHRARVVNLASGIGSSSQYIERTLARQLHHPLSDGVRPLAQRWNRPLNLGCSSHWQLASIDAHGTRVAGGCLLAGDAKLEKTPIPQPADFKSLPSRDVLGPRHVVSRLLAQFETFWASAGDHRVT